MEYAACSHRGGDLSSLRRYAAAFLDNLTGEEGRRPTTLQNWITKWTKIGDEQCLVGDLEASNGDSNQAAEARLCALTAFEVARRLLDENDPQCGEVTAKIEAAVRYLEVALAKVDRVKIASCDDTEFLAYFVPVGDHNLPAPAVICISMEDESQATLLARLLPAVVDRGMSLLVVSHRDVSNPARGISQALLSSCLDFLSARPDVDVARIGVYGEGMSAALATDFAAADRRLVAAVCDGGLWNWTRMQASVLWMTRVADPPEQGRGTVHRTQLMRRLRCPALVVTGGRGVVSVSEAIKLQTECIEERIGLDLAMPRMIESSGGGIENFVASDDCVFGWLKQKLAFNAGPLSQRKDVTHKDSLLLGH
ncbi:hypothetical protein GGD66_002481 [Bradyrhizobium sp. CIR48]|uniref:alpha/beta hydrolase family protein n=1 Tax=Bradyrhizobium sp. CIR48 TaxID=2663840 RepID=UPI001605CAC5|nr:hypothetical protein [Bradyrhizobium sp. CIR48]MBB4423937.1 hypothetical protein [Bradyrhizobium sp. CIR48]